MDPLLWLQAENPSKQPDNDRDCVKMLLECIVLLCQTRSTRQFLRAQKVYPICRNLDYFLEDDKVTMVPCFKFRYPIFLISHSFVYMKVNDIVFEIVNFLEREDDPSEPLDDRKVSSEAGDVNADHIGGGAQQQAPGADSDRVLVLPTPPTPPSPSALGACAADVNDLDGID